MVLSTDAENSAENSRNDYELTRDEVRALTAELLMQSPIEVTDQFVCIPVDGISKFSDIGRQVERDIFETHFKNDAEVMRREYGRYEDSSIFFISVDREAELPTGALRVIRNSPAGLKTINDVAGDPLSLSSDEVLVKHGIDSFDNCWDIGTVAAAPGYPSKAASIQLYRAMYLSAQQEGIEHVVSVVDCVVLKQLQGYLGIPFDPLAGTEPFEYLGSPESQAVYGHVPEFYEKMSRHMRTVRGLLARKALKRLVKGSEDQSILL